MKHRNKTSRDVRTSQARTPHGFTMLELMTVMAIIIILVSIIMPTVGVFLDSSKLKKSQARVFGLDTAVRQYQRELQNDWPGQRYLTSTGAFSAHNLYSDITQGSQWLTMAIFPAKDQSRRHSHSGLYMSYAPDMVDCTGKFSRTGLIDTVLDAFAKPMPILYYASRPRVPGLRQYFNDSYKDVQNNLITFEDSNGFGVFGVNSSGKFDPNVIIDKRYWSNTAYTSDSTMPVMDQQFLLFGSGRDRYYFGYSNDDNVKNFAQ